MYKRFMIALLLVGIVVMTLGGCKGESEPDVVKTDAEYKAEAAEDITKENMLDELDKLEKEIDRDSASQ